MLIDLGVHPAKRLSALADPERVPEPTTETTFTVAMVPSLNWNEIKPCAIPGLRLVKSGCTTTLPGWFGRTVPLAGRGASQRPPSFVCRDDRYSSGADPRLEMANS